MRFGPDCAVCGDEVKPPRKKYCSAACASAKKQQDEKQRPPRPYKAKPKSKCVREGCGNYTKAQRKFCSAECGELVREQYGLAPAVPKDVDLNPGQARAGRGYEIFVREGFARQIADGLVTAEQVAAIKGIEPVQVTRWMNTYWQQVEIEGESAGWELSQDALAALSDFKTFRDLCFVTERGKPYVTKPFHQRWIDAILETIETGSRLQILSPPRHGKTQLLIHFCIWQILRNPHIRILWIAASKDLAERWLSSIEAEFERNEKLRDYFLPPGRDFRPTGAGASWSKSEMVIGTRTRVVKSPSITSLGARSTILSLDADLIIVDDIEDNRSIAIPSSREKTKYWWTVTVGSRIEDHTGVVVIGSRQHVDDLYSVNLRSPRWTTITEAAHDPMCPHPKHDDEKHVDCMLWPEQHPYSWLIEQEEEFTAHTGIEVFEMVYLNAPVETGLAMFRAADIDACKDPSRVIGDIPPGTVLIAGLDPAVTGYQASFLWAYQPASDTQFMVDLENRQGGGIHAARDIIRQWHERYEVSIWRIESANIQGVYLDDDEIRRFAADSGVLIQGHNTGTNKHDPAFGVSQYAVRFSAGKINLPYGDNESKRKVDQYRQQLLGFSADNVAATGKGRGYRSDLVMASWFPWASMRSLRAQQSAQVVWGYKPSFQGYDMATYGSQIPWGTQ